MIDIAVLDAGLDDADWPAGFDDAQRRLAAARAVGTRIAFSEEDIDVWEWSVQAITLSRAATGRLTTALPADTELTDSIRRMKRNHEELGWGNPIGLSLHTRGFVVSLGGDAVYGGVFLEAVSERRVDLPVLRTRLVDGRAILHVLPVHLPFLMVDPGSPDHEVTMDQVAPEARQDRAIAQLLLRQAYGPEALRIRERLRDERLYTALKQTGLLFSR